MESIIKILLLISVFLQLGTSRDCRESNTTQDCASKASPRLIRAHNSDMLEQQLKASLIEKYGTYNQSHRSDFTLASEGGFTASSDSSSFSTTTLQSSGVDESDRLKTDGEYIYVSTVAAPGIKIFKADSHSTPFVSELSVDTQNDAALLSGLYLTPNRQQLIALAGDGSRGGRNADSWFSADYWENRKTDIFTFDISDPTTPEQLNQLTLDGQLISSRRVGSTLYIATRHTAKIPNLIEHLSNPFEALVNRGIISNTSLDELLPTYQINNRRQALFDAQDCFYTGSKQSNYSQQSIISLLAIDLTDATPKPQGQCFIGDAETVYASTSAIYLATTQHQYSDGLNGLIYDASPSTQIHKFSLDDIQTNYAGSASIEGHLGWQQSQKSFRMSEENGILRVLSYVGEEADSMDSPARLHMLKESSNDTSLELLATLPNSDHPEPLGKKGEQIYASRFIGDRGYLVTFRTTDPLYILDLSNPRDPYIISALEVDGYSDYLHPIGENFLLGIGKDAIATTFSEDSEAPSSAWAQGVKLSLIDIRDPYHPLEKQKIILGRRGTETAVSTTHHALATLLRGNTLQVNLPISLHEKAVQNYAPEPHPSDYFGWTQDVLHRLEIDVENGEISTLKPIVAKMNDVPEHAEYFYNTGWQHDRSVIIGGSTYYLKRDEIFTAAN